MADTHITSGIVTVGSGLSAVGSGMNVITSVSGNLIQTSVSGNVLQTSISGNAISISGDILVTSFSGNVITVINPTPSAPILLTNFVQIAGGSGGTQLPDVAVKSGYQVLNTFAGSSGAPQPSTILIGGLGNNAPYSDGTVFPDHNGMSLAQAGLVPVTNLNQSRIFSDVSGAFVSYRAIG